MNEPLVHDRWGHRDWSSLEDNLRKLLTDHSGHQSRYIYVQSTLTEFFSRSRVRSGVSDLSTRMCKRWAPTIKMFAFWLESQSACTCMALPRPLYFLRDPFTAPFPSQPTANCASLRPGDSGFPCLSSSTPAAAEQAGPERKLGKSGRLIWFHIGVSPLNCYKTLVK